MTPELVAAGFVIGILVGLTGVGGGSMMTPLLIYIGLDPLIAVGTDLAYNLPTKLFGWFLHKRQNTVRIDVLKPLALGGIPAALIGLVAVQYAKHWLTYDAMHLWMQRIIGASIILAAIMILVAPLLLSRRSQRAEPDDTANPQVRSRLLLIGAFVGFLVSITSVGSGAVALPLLVLTLPGLGLAELVGTDIAFGAIVVVISLFAHWRMGHVSLPVAVPLASGSMIGVFCGTRLCAMMQQRWLRPALAAALLVAATRLVV